MSVAAAVASGSYLRLLRERCGLSQPEVSRLSGSAPRPLDKGTLSRIEHGQQGIALPTLITLGHIYQVPGEVLLERLELDAELERLGGVETTGRSQFELLRRGRRALLVENDKWQAYGYFRDASLARTSGEVDPPLRDEEEQQAVIHQNLATVARSLGKNRFALHELQELEGRRALGSARHAVLLDRIANCHRCLGNFDGALRYGKAAIAEATFYRELRPLAFALFSLAEIALALGDLQQADQDFHRAFRAYRQAGDGTGAVSPNPAFEVSALLKLADLDQRRGRHDRSGRLALAAMSLSLRRQLPSGRAYAEIALAELDERHGHDERAAARWRRAGEIAMSLRNRRMAFSAEFYAFRHALRRGNRALARIALHKLERLAPWVPPHVPELGEFRDLARQSGGTSEEVRSC